MKATDRFHETFNAIVFSTIISPYMAWYSSSFSCFNEEFRYSRFPLIRRGRQVHDPPREAINTPVNIKPPGSELFVSILVPQGIGTSDFVDPTASC